MRWIGGLCISLLLFGLVNGVASSAEADAPDSSSLTGLVYGYGLKLSRPYEFTKSEDGKTLYLNGLVYAGPGDKQPPEITITEEARAIYDVVLRANEKARQGTTEDDRLARMAAVFRSSPLAESVRQDSHEVHVKWRMYPDEMAFVLMAPFGDGRPDLDRDAFWEKQISRFWWIIDSGGMVVFGERYHIFCPDSSIPKTVKQIERVRRALPRESLDTQDTPLSNQDFLDDLYRESDRAEEE